ncbi:hypothetical protein BKH43_00205 [Helicobacter sp. 13S00401-1]|uniref:hypothetical protein n=1 Tax=Helicobacter sp. 13S00401-1 TaxID=1905758 RepID=UPI000BA76806|nr:hypothetical protein [Helicobacter sp. 13S00401-1]PAF51699.1 hypothetical protein BKH43_00205 [Helicobacter sp. 13S00401-1]
MIESKVVSIRPNDVVSSAKKRILQNKASKAFLASNFEKAFKLYEEAFWIDEDDLESKIGLFLSDIGLSFETEALSIYDLYKNMITLSQKRYKREIQKGILKLIENFDENIANNSNDNALKKQVLEGADTVSYADIESLLENGRFNDGFLGVMFSSKIVFSTKEEFYSFLRLLVKNDYLDMSNRYIESLPYVDEEVLKILGEISLKEKENK